MLQCCCFPQKQVLPLNEDAHSRSIDRQSYISRAREQNVMKLLLLGTGESGKSTFVKQLLTIYGAGFTKKERLDFKVHILANILQSIKALLGAVDNFGFDSTLDSTVKSYLLNVEVIDARTDKNIGDMIQMAWNDSAVQMAFQRKNQFTLNDSAAYFLSKTSLILADSYVPSLEDIMMIRVPSSGIVEREFQNSTGAAFRVIDVGGQRNERRKWIHCFDSVTAIIYIVALSEYDQMLYEDAQMNRMIESLNLFGEICNSPYFRNRPIILFLNKVDLFREKLKTSDLAKTFPEFTGGADPNAAAEFIRNKFERLHRNNDKNPIMSFITCNTDPKTVKLVFEALTQALVRNALMEAGLT